MRSQPNINKFLLFYIFERSTCNYESLSGLEYITNKYALLCLACGFLVQCKLVAAGKICVVLLSVTMGEANTLNGFYNSAKEKKYA